MKALGVIFLILFFRLIPHPPNLTPVLAFTILFSDVWFFVIAGFLMSDIFLGGITVSVYLSLFIILFISQYFKLKNFTWGLGASLYFWIWTNFGVWLSSGMYPFNLAGFLSCYTMALPFLVNSILGCILGYIIIFFCRGRPCACPGDLGTKVHVRARRRGTPT